MTFAHFSWMQKKVHKGRYFNKKSPLIVHPDVGVGHRPSKRVVKLPERALLLKEMWEAALAATSDEPLVPGTAPLAGCEKCQADHNQRSGGAGGADDVEVMEAIKGSAAATQCALCLMIWHPVCCTLVAKATESKEDPPWPPGVGELPGPFRDGRPLCALCRRWWQKQLPASETSSAARAKVVEKPSRRSDELPTKS